MTYKKFHGINLNAFLLVLGQLNSQASQKPYKWSTNYN